jgi:hypothetical protein
LGRTHLVIWQQRLAADSHQRQQDQVPQDKRQEQRAVSLARIRQTSKDEAERNPHELHQQQRSDQFQRAKAEFRAVDHRRLMIVPIPSL